MKINAIDAKNSGLITHKNLKKHKNFEFNSQAGTENPNDKGILNTETLNAYYDINFGGTYENANRRKFNKLKNNFTPVANKIWSTSELLAKRYNSSKITHEHLFLASLLELKKYIEAIESGEKKHKENSTYLTPNIFEGTYGTTVFDDTEKLAKIKPIINKTIRNTAKNIVRSSTSKFNFIEPKPTDVLVGDLLTTYNTVSNELDSDSFSDNILFASALESSSNIVAKKTFGFLTEIQEALMIDDTPLKQKVHLQFYDEKADKLWKNLDLGNDMFITYDGSNTEAPKHLISSFANLINKPGQKYNTLNKDNTDITIFKKEATFDLIETEVEKAKKDKDKTHVFVVNFADALTYTAASRGYSSPMLEMSDVKMLKNKNSDGTPTNVRFVFVADKNIYFANMASGISQAIDDYNMLSIPIVNAQSAKDILNGESGKRYIKAVTNKDFTSKAVERAVELTNSQEGYFPEKAIKYLRNAASYFIDEDMISLEQLEQYEKVTKDLKKTGESSDDIKIIFDTGKKLDDIVGSPMTKAEANSVVERILRHPQNGTRGYTTYLDNGSSSGGGRRHTAEAIAGEAGIPMITINARDFALKDIDALSQNANLSELKIKKLVNTAKTQAEANNNKTAMIFIENFDNFGSDPLYGISSIYEQKAFTQLLSEMENVRKNEDVNLVVVGSTNRPEYLDENIMKPYKFLDSIVIYSPKDTKDREDILNYYIEKKGLKIEGDTPEQKAQLVKNMAETTKYFSVVDLMYTLERAEDISKERDKDAIDKSDFTEAFLQLTSGRVSSAHRAEHTDEIVSAHECGHAITMEIMYDLAKKQDKPWYLPDKVNFIALDPRGDYLGAMYPKNSDNQESNLETVFANLVCDFGGHCVENHLYNMTGSWGITGDSQMATRMAYMAVEKMGLGAKTGKMYISRNELGLSDVSPKLKSQIEDDAKVLLENSKTASNKIVQAYEGFIQEFADKYKDKVGTGDCLITSDEFTSELKEWKERQGKDKQQEFAVLEKEILDIIEKTKQGKLAEKK